jgi:hypothetical protein
VSQVRRAGRLALAAAVALAGCGPAAPAVPTPVVGPRPAAPSASAARSAAPVAPARPDEPPAADAAAEAKISAMLERVVAARGLPAKRPVKSRVLDRDAILARIRAHVDREVPKEVIAMQGEVLSALELVPADYDFVAGMYALIGGRIAGFYEPDDGTMYLVDDLGDEDVVETLAHELVHALQDQSYGLGPLLRYAPGQSDKLAAVHALAEGDATSAMLDVAIGSAFAVSDGALRRMFALSTAFSTAGAKTPHALQASLIAPYSDGFALVQALRKQSGWPGVDGAWRSLPTTTEQLLHADKLATHEPAIDVPVPTTEPLGAPWRTAIDDVMGEQGLRIVFEEWTDRAAAARAAAGWGGDRYAVAVRDLDGGAREYAVGWSLVMDTVADAKEVARVLSGRLGAKCRERKDLGPIAWQARGAELAIVAGPYRRDGLAARSAGDCALATRWLGALLKPR